MPSRFEYGIAGAARGMREGLVSLQGYVQQRSLWDRRIKLLHDIETRRHNYASERARIRRDHETRLQENKFAHDNAATSQLPVPGKGIINLDRSGQSTGLVIDPTTGQPVSVPRQITEGQKVYAKTLSDQIKGLRKMASDPMYESQWEAIRDEIAVKTEELKTLTLGIPELTPDPGGEETPDGFADPNLEPDLELAPREGAGSGALSQILDSATSGPHVNWDQISGIVKSGKQLFDDLTAKYRPGARGDGPRLTGRGTLPVDRGQPTAPALPPETGGSAPGEAQGLPAAPVAAPAPTGPSSRGLVYPEGQIEEQTLMPGPMGEGQVWSPRQAPVPNPDTGNPVSAPVPPMGASITRNPVPAAPADPSGHIEIGDPFPVQAGAAAPGGQATYFGDPRYYGSDVNAALERAFGVGGDPATPEPSNPRLTGRGTLPADRERGGIVSERNPLWSVRRGQEPTPEFTVSDLEQSTSAMSDKEWKEIYGEHGERYPHEAKQAVVQKVVSFWANLPEKTMQQAIDAGIKRVGKEKWDTLNHIQRLVVLERLFSHDDHTVSEKRHLDMLWHLPAQYASHANLVESDFQFDWKP